MTRSKTRIGWQIAGACLLIGCSSSGSKHSPAMAQTTPQRPPAAQVNGQTAPSTVSPSDVPSSAKSSPGLEEGTTRSDVAAPVTGEPEIRMRNDQINAERQAVPPSATQLRGTSGTIPDGTSPPAQDKNGPSNSNDLNKTDATGMGAGNTGANALPSAEQNHAEATLKMLDEKGDTVGTMTFDQNGKQVAMKGTFTGLKPGKHGISIHEKGDCGGKMAQNAGDHFNPSKSKHGPPESGTRHAGDFGNITVDKEGNASFEMSTDSLTVTPGVDSIAGRSIIIHAKADNGKTQPNGAEGAALACGVIEVK